MLQAALSESASAQSAVSAACMFTSLFLKSRGIGAQAGTDHLSDLQVENMMKVILLTWVSKASLGEFYHTLPL